MPELFWDLRENATRAYLLQETLSHLGAAEREAVLTAAEASGISDRHHHDFGDVCAALDAAQVSERVRADAQAIYRILAEAEAQAHGCSVEETHFHEVGNGATIRMTLGICLAIERIAPSAIIATPVQVGSGTVDCAHGTLSIPAPATAAILSRGIPVWLEKGEGELCTPTSAAIICHFVDRFEA